MGVFRRHAESIASEELGANPPSATGWFVPTRAVLAREMANPYFAALNNMSVMDMERLSGDTVKDGVSVVFREPGKKGGTAKINPKMSASLTSNDGGKTAVTISVDDPAVANMADAVFQGSRNQTPTVVGYTRLDSLYTGVNSTPHDVATNAPAPRTSTGSLPHVDAAANELRDRFSGIVDIGGYRANAHDPNGHPAGRALDVMVTRLGHLPNAEQASLGDAVANYALDNKRRLGVQYVIWKGRINSGDGRGWRQMKDRGGVTANHFDHPHINFEAALPEGAASMARDAHDGAASHNGHLPKDIDPRTGRETRVAANDGRNHQGGNARVGTALRSQREMNALARGGMAIGARP